MKSVLISIQKPHTDNIGALIKTIEVRKNRPNIPTPFPVFIYETKAKGGCGKVIGEFVCDRIDKYKFNWAEFTAYGNKTYLITETQLKNTCLSREDFDAYGCAKNGHSEKLYGWHISDLIIYDKPKELSEFKVKCENSIWFFEKKIERPPQSWCYVE